MQAKEVDWEEKLADMIRYKSEKQSTLDGFQTFFERALDGENRWAKLAKLMPWDEMADGYYRSMAAGMGRPAKDARLVIGAVIIKHKLCLSDEETIEQIRENPYLQYFVGFSEFQLGAAFAPSLFVDIRRRMGEKVFEEFNLAIVNRIEVDARKKKDVGMKEDATKEPISAVVSENGTSPINETKAEEEIRKGRMILDATVAEQAIKYPTDLDLLNESREISEQIIDALQSETAKKPRTYRQVARKKYLAVVKRRKASWKIIQQGIKEQLQYVRRNLKHINTLLDNPETSKIPLVHKMLRKYWIIQQIYAQQDEMYRTKSRRCDDRIVSIHQPQVRPIVRGKANKAVEFGAKLGVSLTDGIASVDRINWDAYNEGEDLIPQVEAYKKRYGYYPETVSADPIYGTLANRKWLKENGIKFAGKPLGRPPKETSENKKAKQQRHEDYCRRIPIEGKFGQGKNAYGLDYIRAKTARTSEAWIRSIFFVMNLIFFEKVLFWLLKITTVIRQNRQWAPLSAKNIQKYRYPTQRFRFNQINLPNF